jgi:pyridinium-3,5-bisthiocarboxylic acid mononucleotide nickel chelatase
VRTLYFDCFAGVAGDMMLGALIDAGASAEAVRATIESLGMKGWDVELATVSRGGIRATRATVHVQEAGNGRSYRDIVALLERPALSPEVAHRARDTFDVLAHAEARIHDIPVDDVHFHEVGSTDAIIDVVGCCAALDQLAVERVVTSPIATGTGTLAARHGMLPLPAPAVLELLSRRGATLYGRGQEELVTPTGAALVATLSDQFGELPTMTIDATGYGAGARELEFPNVLRVIVGTQHAHAGARTKELVLEANVDDMSPELLPHVVDVLLANGAQDAWITPIVMKKGRPAYTLSALVAPESERRVAESLFRETTTLGVRMTPVTKHALTRRWLDVVVAGHPVRVKLGALNGEVTVMSPEHDDARAVAHATGLALRDVYTAAALAARAALDD